MERGSSDPPQPCLPSKDVNRTSLESLLQVVAVALMRAAAVCSGIAFHDTRDACSYLHFEDSSETLSNSPKVAQLVGMKHKLKLRLGPT